MLAVFDDTFFADRGTVTVTSLLGAPPGYCGQQAKPGIVTIMTCTTSRLQMGLAGMIKTPEYR